jgi:hypothetical protein
MENQPQLATADAVPPPQEPPIDSGRIPWVPLSPGLSFKPLRFFRKDRGYLLLLRVEPGTLIPRHRHTGEVHAFNLSGQRLLIESNQLVGPGGYVHEPAGNVDSWQAVGDQPAIVHVTVHGPIDYLGADGQVVRRVSSGAQEQAYRRYCAEHGLQPLDLCE